MSGKRDRNARPGKVWTWQKGKTSDRTAGLHSYESLPKAVAIFPQQAHSHQDPDGGGLF